MKSLIATTALLGFIIAAALLTTAVDAYKTKFVWNISVTTFDNFSLHADAVIPVPERPGEQFPVVIFPNSWGMPQIEYILNDFGLGKEGYIAFEYETRGWYMSGGTIDCAGPKDLKDASSMIDYVLSRAREWNVNISAVAFAGVSYGAGISLLMAGYDSRVKTACAMSGWGNLTSSLFPDSCPATNTMETLMLLADVVGHPSAELKKMYQDVLHYTNVSEVEQYGDMRSPARLLDQINARKVPVFMSNNFQDWFFPPNFVLDFHARLQGPKIMLMNQGGHAEPEIFGLLDVPDNYIFDRFRRWLGFFLKGVPTGILDEPPVQMETGNTVFSGKYQPYQSWPVTGAVQMVPFKLSARGGNAFGGLSSPITTTHGGRVHNHNHNHNHNHDEKKQHPLPPRLHHQHHSRHLSLSSIAGGDGADSIKFSKFSGLTCGTIVSDYAAPLGIPFDSELLAAPREHSIVFRSDMFSDTTLFCGMPPLINITVTPSADSWQIYAFLYDVDALVDVGRLISFVGFSKHHGQANRPYKIENWQLRTMCTEIPAGHRLAVGFTLYNNLFEAAGDMSQLSAAFSYEDATLSMPMNPK